MEEHRERAAALLGDAPFWAKVSLQYTKGTAQVVVVHGNEESITSIPDGRGLEEGVCLALELAKQRAPMPPPPLDGAWLALQAIVNAEDEEMPVDAGAPERAMHEGRLSDAFDRARTLLAEYVLKRMVS